ncbi:hypothetical protein [Escherichia coli]|uniref:hypothetical protein n=1 Tax=Escherichia coli TaxID=562 RepID=UPI000CFBE729|nr:hypothetical protein [Escherichia coli]
MDKSDLNQKKNGIASMIERTKEQLAEDKSRRLYTREQARTSELKRRILEELSRDNNETPKRFALEEFLSKSPCLRKR